MRALVEACDLASSSFFHEARKLSMTVACFQTSSSALPSMVIGLSVKRQSKVKEGWVCAREKVEIEMTENRTRSNFRMSISPLSIKLDDALSMPQCAT